MRNHEVTKPQKLLNGNGEIAEPGWSRKQVQRYKRADIKASALRIKEWDYYLILNKDFGVALTLSDDGYIGLQSATFLKFTDKPFEHTETILNMFPLGKLKMPETAASGNSFYKDKRLMLLFELSENPSGKGKKRRLVCNFKNFYNGKPFKCDIVLDEPETDSMVIATPWNKKSAFYFNQKINCMRASGNVDFDGKIYTFDPKTDFGTLDWGRGVWTYDNTWYWGNCNCDMGGHAFGFNIGYGFGNTTAASENVLFWDGVAHKLDDVRFVIPGDDGPNPLKNGGAEVKPGGGGSMDAPDYMEKWKFTSSDGRFETEFVPIIDRSAKLDLKLICSDQHQVFGKMSGTAILDDGKKIELKDVLCFAEKVHNKY